VNLPDNDRNEEWFTTSAEDFQATFAGIVNSRYFVCWLLSRNFTWTGSP